MCQTTKEKETAECLPSISIYRTENFSSLKEAPSVAGPVLFW